MNAGGTAGEPGGGQAGDRPAAGRRARVSSREARERVLAAASTVFERTGLTVGFDHVRLENLIRLAGVPRSSVYRIWSSRDEFVADLVVELSTRHRADVGAGPAAIVPPGTPPPGPAAFREAVAAEAVRQLGATVASTLWRTRLALLASAAAPADDAVRRAVLDSLARLEEQRTASAGDHYGRLLDAAGRRMRAGLSVADLAAASNALVDGWAIRSTVLAGADLTGPTAAFLEGAGAAVAALVESMVEETGGRQSR